jgi:hypothetical protein
MSYGYSILTIDRNKAADGSKLGVALGRVCIEKCIPVTEVANKIKVTRQTVYNWFEGTTNPNDYYTHEIASFLSSLR